MYIQHDDSKREDWDQVKSWNYKLPHLEKSVVYAEIIGEHGEVSTKTSEWIYFIIEGSGEFTIDGIKTTVNSQDVITVPANTKYNYRSLTDTPLKVVMFIDIWDN